MANAFTTDATLNSAGTTAFEKLAYFNLRPQLHFQGIASVKPTNETHKGATVQFTMYDDLAPATTPLSETVDVDAVAISDDVSTVTLQEYGNAAITTARARNTSYMQVDADAAKLIGYNAGLTMNTLALTAIVAGTNVLYGSGGASDPTARNTIAAEDTLSAVDVRRALALLKSNNVMGFPGIGGMYRAFIHPMVSFDLRSETGAASWRDPHVYSDPGRIYNGSIGSFEGFEFIEDSSTGMTVANAGAGSTVDVYHTLFVGDQALAFAHAKSDEYRADGMPTIVHGEVTDKLKRLRPVGWKAFMGWNIFRQDAIYRVESSSSIGANT